METAPRPWRRVEIWLAAAVLAASLLSAGLTARAMATSSLSTDEFGTVGTFSSRGPWRVITDYRAPKNHIFFNLLNSVLPGRESLDPARARALSIAATLLTGALIAAYAARRGQWLEGAALVGVWTLAPEALTLSMEARGYGFLGLFAVVAAIATLEYFRRPRRRWLVALGLAAALGVYTIPSFLFFAGPLLLLIWLAKRTRETFLAGALAGVAILLLYAPVLPQLAAAFGQYQTSDEAEFSRISSLWKAVRLFVAPGPDAAMVAVLAALLLAPLALFRWQSSDRAGLVLVAAASALYFAILLVLHTPPLRVAAFGFLPAMLAGFLATGAAIRRSPAALRPLFAVGVSAVLLLSLFRAARDFDFLPTENWTLAGRAIDAGFPKETRVDFRRFAKYLRHTLPDAESRSADFDAAAFARGELIVADAGNKWVEPPRFHPPANVPDVLQWIIPGRIRDTILTFRRPADSAAEGIPPALADGDARTTLALPPSGTTLRLVPPATARALVVLLDQTTATRQLDVRAGGAAAFLAGNAVVVPLLPTSSRPIEVTLRPRVDGLAATEAWIVR